MGEQENGRADARAGSTVRRPPLVPLILGSGVLGQLIDDPANERVVVDPAGSLDLRYPYRPAPG